MPCLANAAKALELPKEKAVFSFLDGIIIGTGVHAMPLSTILGTMLGGLGMAGIIFIVALAGSLPLGVLVALCRMSKNRVLSFLAKIYISFLRGTPLILQLMFIYFAPYYIFGLKLSLTWRMGACFIGFILNYAAYFAEIYRAGIQSIPRGQYEAASVLGYSRSQTFTKIVFPQVIKRIAPAMGNEVITLIKDTSLAFVLSIAEMFTMAETLAAAMVSMIPYVLAAALYWFFTLLVEFALGKFEKKLSYYHD